MKQKQLIIAATLIVIIAGGAHGWRTNRWIANESLEAAKQRVAAVPSEIGRWKSTDFDLTEMEVSVGEIEGYIKREYIHQDTGAVAHVLLVTGEAGPISVHPPTSCLSSRGYQLVRNPTILPFKGKHQFSHADFKNSAIDDASLIRVYWGWSSGDQWQTPSSPRIAFAGEPVLFKLYVSEQWFPTGNTQEDAGASKLLMADLLPAIDAAFARSSREENDAN